METEPPCSMGGLSPRLDWQDCSLAIGLQQGIETMFSILKRTTCDYLQKDSPTFSLDKGEENKICRGSTGGEKRSVAVTKAPLTSCVCAAIPTPPPDCSPRLASTLQKESKGFTHGESFVKGSTLDENSWGCSSEREDCSVAVQVQVRCEVEDETATGENGQERGSNKLSLKRIREVDSSEEDELPLPKNLKLPQRKGGMQLWQFLYTLLTDPKKRYSEMIDWTDKENRWEFRLQEPEAIAIWWGEHKNRKNMSYEKLSRSLRYYYDKGIIKKMSGESSRYVYQFCINPELMYKHIGISESRPKLKPMPPNARCKYQKKHSTHSGKVEAACKLTAGIQAPLQNCLQHPYPPHAFHSVSMLPSSTSLPPMPFFLPPPPPPPPPPPRIDTFALETNPLLDIGCFSSPSPMMGDFKPSPLKRHSAPSCTLESKQPHNFLIDQQFQATYPHHTTPLTLGVSPLSVDPASPVTPCSSQSSPLSTHTYASDSDDLELDELIALTSCESYNHSPSDISSGRDSPFFW